jgi:hypothetical protein
LIGSLVAPAPVDIQLRTVGPEFVEDQHCGPPRLHVDWGKHLELTGATPRIARVLRTFSHNSARRGEKSLPAILIICSEEADVWRSLESERLRVWS